MQPDEDESREEQEGEEGGVSFIAHVPVPSQREVRHTRSFIYTCEQRCPHMDANTSPHRGETALPVSGTRLTALTCLFLRWRRLWSGGRRWSCYSATPARRFRLRVKRPELCWDSDLSVCHLSVCLSVCHLSVLHLM